MKWSKTWPKKPGKYWFYGWRWKPAPDDKPELFLVEMVGLTGNGYPMYSTHGHFLEKSEGADGVWLKAVLPDLPNLEEYHGKET